MPWNARKLDRYGLEYQKFLNCLAMNPKDFIMSAFDALLDLNDEDILLTIQSPCTGRFRRELTGCS